MWIIDVSYINNPHFLKEVQQIQIDFRFDVLFSQLTIASVISSVYKIFFYTKD